MSLLHLITPLSNLNVVTGANSSGKSNLYKSLRLLAKTAQRIGLHFGYAISLGVSTLSHSAFSLDPEIKKECIWARNTFLPASL
ncbi:AAA family ATPase [Teredinibacter haidensis]|uniref:AAA family ATPase n=1 Tax=Teredinibacter haidensis TaxID=2731755 RepID=UPI0009490FE9